MSIDLEARAKLLLDADLVDDPDMANIAFIDVPNLIGLRKAEARSWIKWVVTGSDFDVHSVSGHGTYVAPARAQNFSGNLPRGEMSELTQHARSWYFLNIEEASDRVPRDFHAVENSEPVEPPKPKAQLVSRRGQMVWET